MVYVVKWFYVAKSGEEWIKVDKSGDFMWLCGFMWLNGFMWLKVVKGGEKWGKVRKSGE